MATHESEWLNQAQRGDREAFGLLAERYRREMHVHCYHMLGSLADADDAVQEAFLRAWRGIDGFAGRSSFRSWLYSIATNACLDALATRKRSLRTLPERLGPPSSEPPEGETLREIRWLEPYPDAALERIADASPEPEELHETREAVELAFVAAVQHLPPRQRAVLLLRDVLQCSAAETAGMLDMTVASVNSALQRSRATTKAQSGPGARPARPAPTAQQRKLIERYVRAWEHTDLDALVALLREDAVLSMPPIPEWYCGVQAIRATLASVWTQLDGPFILLPTSANGQPAFVHYAESADGSERHAHAVHVLTLDGAAIAAMTLFRDPHVVERFAR